MCFVFHLLRFRLNAYCLETIFGCLEAPLAMGSTTFLPSDSLIPAPLASWFFPTASPTGQTMWPMIQCSFWTQASGIDIAKLALGEVFVGQVRDSPKRMFQLGSNLCQFADFMGQWCWAGLEPCTHVRDFWRVLLPTSPNLSKPNLSKLINGVFIQINPNQWMDNNFILLSIYVNLRVARKKFR